MDRLIAIKSDPQIIESIFDHVSNGGSLIDLCKMWKLKYSDVIKAIRSDKDLKAKYDQALTDRDEWSKERVLSEVKALATFNIKDIFKEDGTVKRPHELPDHLTAAIKEVTADGDIKFVDKVKPLDMLGKQSGLFADRTEITGSLTLEQVILAARNRHKEVK